MRAKCNPDADPTTAAACSHLNVQKGQVARANSWVDRLFATNELKTFGATIAIIVFVIATFQSEKLEDVQVLKEASEAWDVKGLTSTTWLYATFAASILLHHARMFLGLTFADSGGEDAARDPAGEEERLARRANETISASKMYNPQRWLRFIVYGVISALLKIVRIFHNKSAIQDDVSKMIIAGRWLRTACVLTFPLFSIFLFIEDTRPMFWVWSTQLTCMWIFNGLLLRSFVAENRGYVILSDVLSTIVAILFCYPLLFGRIIVSELEFDNPGIVAMVFLLALVGFQLAVAIPEFWKVYRKQLFKNLANGGEYLIGARLSAPHSKE